MENKICKLQERCGACQLLHLSYSQSIEYKKKYVIDSFKNEGINIKIDKVIEAKEPYKYRNKMIIAFQMNKGKVISGFFEENSHKIINLDNCIMHSDIQNRIANYIKKLVIDFHVSIYDEDRRTGLLRYVLIREAVHTKEILITFVLASDIFPSSKEIIRRLTSEFKEIKAVIQNVNNRKTSIVLGEKEKVLYGKPYIEDELMGLKFKITSKSFYQVNPIQVEYLYKEAINAIKFKGDETVIDAYSGIGTIGLILSKNVERVISVENNRQAYLAAIQNAKDNNIRNVHFVNADATEFIKDLENEKIDYVIMDPPRTGSTNQFLNYLLKLQPKGIIYVSCGPDTLARDLKVLLSKYKIDHISLVDMFCFTKHVESVCLLKNRAGNN
ncbi:MAG: 23S rRNA (uracil(1939)-C(5))-methyltransferase RlmD [Bacilli bacterium]|nr:23S rRNA (uracil(1939)-C(5))-methyltransferase RlmD [Bacilli bacterium]